MRAVVGQVERPEPLRFGDPVDCGYRWLDPDQVVAYGDTVRRVGRKVDLAVDAFDRLATLPQETFAGEAAESLRVRAARRGTQAEETRASLEGLARAVHDYAEVLRQHRRSLADLHDLALARGLMVEGHKILPPVQTLVSDASQRDVDAWRAGWKAYEACYEQRLEIRRARVQGTRELVRTIAELTGVRPDEDRATHVGTGHGQVDFGARRLSELRRDAAEEAMEAVAAHSEAQRLQATVDALRRKEVAALHELERLLRADADSAQLRAQADKVVLLHHEVEEARVDLAAAGAAASREQAEADRAARRAEEAASRPRDLHQRLG